jgi:hypothetical protein
MGWDSALPAPVIAGATATYALDASRDLVLTARLDGFEQSVVLKDRPAVGEKVEPVVLPLTLEGTDAVTVEGGGIAFEATKTTGKGETKVKAGEDVFAIQAPVMYSAAKDAKTGEHTQVAELPQKLAQDPKAGVDAGVTLTPDPAFLADPKTVYPVTIDPVVSAVGAIDDTWIRNGDTAVHGAEDEISAGIWGESWQDSAALIQFDDWQFKWHHVTSASLNLFNSFSGSCEANWVGVYPVDSAWNPATVTYETSPGTIQDGDHARWQQFSHGDHLLADRWAGKHKVDIALTAASFVPGVGAAVWAYRGYCAYNATRAVLSSARIGNRLYKSRSLGATSRLLGDKYSGAAKPGLLQGGKRWGLGWSGKTAVKVNGKKRARTVLRMKMRGRHFDLFHGPWR